MHLTIWPAHGAKMPWAQISIPCLKKIPACFHYLTQALALEEELELEEALALADQAVCVAENEAARVTRSPPHSFTQ